MFGNIGIEKASHGPPLNLSYHCGVRGFFHQWDCSSPTDPRTLISIQPVSTADKTEGRSVFSSNCLCNGKRPGLLPQHFYSSMINHY